MSAAPLLVFGAGGQLASEVIALGQDRSLNVIGVSRTEADICDMEAVARALDAVKPRLILNAAAYTAVDKAESEPDLAFAANLVGAKNLAVAANARGIPLIHISTDYVFDGTKQGAYSENDPTAPLGIYGKSKAAGEEAIRQATSRHIILRTSWVYGIYGHNFLKTMLRLALERDELRVVSDQYGSPTCTQDLTEAVFAVDRFLSHSNQDDQTACFGTYHFAGTGITNWCEFAGYIIRESAHFTSLVPIVTPITSADYPTPAKRPANSALYSGKFANSFGYVSQHWQARVEQTVQKLFNKPHNGVEA